MAIRFFASAAAFLAIANFLHAEPGQATAFMPREGRGVTYTIDQTTPLPDLIKRLDSWQRVETGKAYLVGYTNDMFSIAAHGDAALPLLRSYIKTTPTPHAKVGAIYTIALIGIDSCPEDDAFLDPAARQALLDLLGDPDCTAACMDFLIREPWRSDIPALMDALGHGNPSDWTIVNGLVYHYALKGLPVGNPIPKSILDEQIFVPEARFKKIPDYPLNVIKLLCDVQSTEFKMDPALLGGIEPNGAAWGPDHTSSIASLLNYFDIPVEQHPRSPLMHLWDTRYKFQYYFENGVVYFCTPPTARQRILGWYILHQQDYAIDKAGRAKKLALIQDNVRQLRALNEQIAAIKLPDVMPQKLTFLNAHPGATFTLPADYVAAQQHLEQLETQKGKLLHDRRALDP